MIPRILECLPQRIDRDSFLLALYLAAEAGSPYFRLGYNSLGAFATINHLHFQVFPSACLFVMLSTFNAVNFFVTECDSVIELLAGLLPGCTISN